MKNDNHSSIQVIDRAVGLLQALAQNDDSASLKILAADSGLHASTAFRILGALTVHGLVDKDTQGNYRLGTRLLTWGERVRSRMDVRVEARPVMEWLRDQVQETVNLTVREHDEVVYVDRAIGRRAIRVEQVVGSRAPLHVTAVGKLMLGRLGAAAWSAYAQRTGLPRFTDNTLSSPAALVQEIEQGLRDGYALDNEEAELGVGCIGVLIHDASGSVVAGLSISAPIERRDPAWIPLVQEAGRRLSARLGYHG